MTTPCVFVVCVRSCACVAWLCSASDSKAATHTFAAPGLYTVRISGRMSGFGFGQPNGSSFNEHKDGHKLVDIVQWGCVRFGNRGGYFYQCRNLGRLSARDLPDLTGVTNMRGMFCYASAFQSDLSQWNVSSVTNMGCMFMFASAFQSDLSQWNVSSVTYMDRMFMFASAFRLPAHAPWYKR